MKKTAILLLALAASLPAAELVPARIPASAKWFLHADLDAMRESETGKAVFAQIEAEHGAKLTALKRMFSIHLINDLQDITLFGDGLPDHSVVLLQGNFNRGHITDVLKAADEYSESQHAGLTVMSWKDKGKNQNATFFDDRLLAFSNQGDSLMEGLDVLKANKPVDADPFFAAVGGRPLISASAKISGIKLPEDASAMLRLARTIKLAANEHDGRFTLRMDVESPDPKHANRLSRILDGVVAVSQVVNTDLGELDLRSDINSAQGKSAVSATLSLPMPEWVTLMEKEAAKKRAKSAGEN